MAYLDYTGLQRFLQNINTIYGSSLTLAIDSDYKLTASLKNKEGVVISTSNAIDLPIESMVVSASYDNTTKEITFTLQNGQTIVVSIADIVSGLQTEITAQNKLSSDLVTDTNNTNKFVTSAEKTKLAGIENGAEVNAIQTVKVNGSALTPDANRAVDITIPANTNQTVKVGNDTFGADDVVEFVAGSNVTITANTSAKTITVTATDTTYSSLSAVSGGTAVSLCTTGEKYTWNNKQDAMGAISNNDIDALFT